MGQIEASEYGNKRRTEIHSFVCWIMAKGEEVMNKLEQIRKKIRENPEGALAILDMMAQVATRETVIEICNDDNLSPVEKADRVLVFLDVPMDKVLDDMEIKVLTDNLCKYRNWLEEVEEGN